MPVIKKFKRDFARIAMATTVAAVILATLNLLLFLLLSFTDVLDAYTGQDFHSLLSISITIGVLTSIMSIIFGAIALSRRPPAPRIVAIGMVILFCRLLGDRVG